MHVDFDTLNDTSRVWIYQSNKAFSSEEVKELEPLLENFTGQWQSHGAPVNASFKVLLNQFIILAVDDLGPGVGGCSIDSSVHFMQELEKKLNISLLNKSDMAFLANDVIKILPFNKVKEAITNKLLSKDDYYFNNTVTQLNQFKKDWKQKLENSWVAKYF